MTDSNHEPREDPTDSAPQRTGSAAESIAAEGAAVGVGPPPASASADQFGRIQRRNFRLAGTVVGVLLAAVIIGGFTYHTPYVALVPGSARDTEPLVVVSGADDFPSEGEVLFTTVRFKTRPNLWSYLWLTTDDDAQILPEEVIFGDQTPDENREANLQAMNDSKSTAVAVALEQLGYDAITPNGVFVAQVVAGSAAEGRLEVGDVILSIDGVSILTDIDLVETLKTKSPGDKIVLGVQAFGSSDVSDVSIVLGERDGDATSAFLGVQPQTRVEFVSDHPFMVDIDSGSVGGPSAGLAFTLAVLDQLTPGELTGGARVAVTGTMSPDGRVGSVGGVPQKAAAVRDLGIKFFIVPKALGEETIAVVRERAGDDVQVVPVADLDEALAALEALGGDTQAINEFAAAHLGDTGE